MNIIRRVAVFSAIVLSCGIGCGTLSADTITSTWAGGTGFWSDPQQWILPGVPQAGEQVLINNTTPDSLVTVDVPTAQLSNVGIASQASLTLAADLSAGELTSYGAVTVGSGATLNAGSGGFVQDTATAATTVSAGGSFLDTGTYSQGNGSTFVNGQFTTPLFHVTGGTVTAGSTGVLTIGAGGYTQDGSVTTQINSGGQLNLAGDFSQGNGATIVNGTLSTALFHVTGGTVNVGAGGMLSVGSGGYAQGNAGTSTTIAAGGELNVVGGDYSQEISTSTIVDGTLNATAVNNSGTVTGSGAINGAFNDLGTIEPGDAGLGSLSVSGNYSQTGFLVTELSDLGVPDADNVLNVGGEASLNGTLDISLQNGFDPSLGETFLVMTYASETGDFYDIAGSSLPADEFWNATYDANDLYVTAEMGVPEAPEPAAFLLSATGLAAALFAKRKIGNYPGPGRRIASESGSR